MIFWINRKLRKLLRASATVQGLAARQLAWNILDATLGLSEQEQGMVLTELARRRIATKRAHALTVKECQDYEIDKELYLRAKGRRHAMREDPPNK